MQQLPEGTKEVVQCSKGIAFLQNPNYLHNVCMYSVNAHILPFKSHVWVSYSLRKELTNACNREPLRSIGMASHLPSTRHSNAGRRFDHEERKRKKDARQVHKRAEVARNSIGLKGKMLTKKRHAEKAQMKKTIAMHEEKDSKRKADDGAPQNAVPAYLLEREQVRRARGLLTPGVHLLLTTLFGMRLGRVGKILKEQGCCIGHLAC